MVLQVHGLMHMNLLRMHRSNYSSEQMLNEHILYCKGGTSSKNCSTMNFKTVRSVQSALVAQKAG